MTQKSVPERFAKKRAAREAQERGSVRSRYIEPETAEPRLVGYARVSTDEQTTRLQLDALKAAGCERIFQDKLGGALRSRPPMDHALAYLRAGDALIVWKLDRLGRSLRNLLEIAETLHERNIALRSLTEHIDTATAAGKIMYRSWAQCSTHRAGWTLDALSGVRNTVI